jgi:hypothetical protein
MASMRAFGWIGAAPGEGALDGERKQDASNSLASRPVPHIHRPYRLYSIIYSII